MTKADIVEKVADRCGFSKKDSIDMVESVFSILKNALEDGEDIKISGFGKFECKNQAGPQRQKSSNRGINSH